MTPPLLSPRSEAERDEDCNIAASRMQRRVCWHDILSALGETELADEALNRRLDPETWRTA